MRGNLHVRFLEGWGAGNRASATRCAISFHLTEIGVNTAGSVSEEVQQLKSNLIQSITEYMKYGGAEDENDPDYDPDFNPGYTQEHVDHCDAVLTAYLATLAKVDGAEKRTAIMDAVKLAVLALNDVNAKCDGNMIETDQREQICELIIMAASNAGIDTEDDITEEWREW